MRGKATQSLCNADSFDAKEVGIVKLGLSNATDKFLENFYRFGIQVCDSDSINGSINGKC